LRLIAHLSDLHFGRVDEAVLPSIVATLAAAKPHLVVVSGDLTQRARAREFAQARDFLDKLPRPQIVVPGNHDVPLYDFLSRWLTPLTGYRRFISDDLEPFFADDEIAVLGVNTARSNTIKEGRINRSQVARAASRLDACPNDVTRIVVTHHPFDFSERGAPVRVIGRARMAMAGFAQVRVDMILSGHMHRTETVDSSGRYDQLGRSILLVQAGTATSTRQRGELNSFNMIRVEGSRVGVDSLVFDAQGGTFRCSSSREFLRIGEAWRSDQPNREAIAE
jgi:3',5'-cyclic AMP phosphodiesterase CpdA